MGAKVLFPADSPLGFAPEGWPIIESGLLMAYIGRILVVRVDSKLTDRAFERYVTEWPRGIDTRSRDARAAAFYDIPSWPSFNAVRRRRVAEMLKSREEMLRATTRAWALTTPSTIVRGMIQAIFWIAPPKYPHEICNSSRAAFAFIERYVPEVDTGAVESDYGALLARS